MLVFIAKMNTPTTFISNVVDDAFQSMTCRSYIGYMEDSTSVNSKELPDTYFQMTSISYIARSSPMSEQFRPR